jgi:ATP-dependent Clp protease ATP-binding subunit ClpA
VRKTIESVDGERVTGQIPFTPEAKKSLEHALREALSLGHNYIGTEHILLGLARSETPPLYLVDFLGKDYQEKIRNEVVRMLSGPTKVDAERMKAMTKAQIAAKAPTPSIIVYLDNAEMRFFGVVHFEKLDGDYLFESESDGIKTLIPAHRLLKVEIIR